MAAVARVLNDFHDAASKADFDRYFSHWTDRSVFLGTDATERWVGREFQEFARPHFGKGKGWTYRPHDRHVSLVPGGQTAYFDELLDHEKLGLCRGSGVLARQGGGWKVLQYNLSIPIPNDLADEFAQRIRTLKPPAPPERKR
jgi:ketosteroid isomerase-like protein